jgi:Lhr-like helicase
MTVPRSVADVLADHVTLTVECIDRMYLNLYVPKLQYEGGVVGFFKGNRGARFASSALMDPMTKKFVSDVEAFVADHGVELVTFEKGQRKDDLAHEYLAAFDKDEGVLFVGKAQEKTTAYRTEKRRNPETGSALPVDRPGHDFRQPLLLLLRRSRLRALLHQVLQLLPLQRQALSQRQ